MYCMWAFLENKEENISASLNLFYLLSFSHILGGISNDYTLASDVKKPAEKSVMPPKAENKVRAFTSPQSEVFKPCF